ncbi:MAG: soxA [Frankiales bacterium]|nr:soxA [Frankiales bacterium]
MTYDVVVVGLGGMGSAAAAALARRGQRVLGLDRYRPVHDQGASHGETRIVRKAYFEGSAYVPLLLRAYELWDELGLLTRNGGLFLGAPDSRVLAGSLATAQEWDLPHELLDAAEVHRRFPAFTPPGDTVALLERDAGWVSPEAAVGAQLERAARAGAELHHQEPVDAWEATADGVRVTTARGTYEAGALVLAPGRWAVDLLPEAPVPLRVEERRVHFFPGTAGDFAQERFPVWIWERPDGTVPYGFPDLGSGVKAAVHHSRLRPAAEWPGEDVGELLAPLLRGLGPRPLRTVDCTYTLTPDEHFVLGRHAAHERVLVACGFSGHGFKLTPVLGEALADLAVAGSTPHDLSLFDPCRPLRA